MKKKMSLRAKAVLLVSLFMLTTNLALGVILMQQARTATKTQINGRMLDIVNAASGIMNGDVLEHLTAEDKDTPEYQNVLNTLTRLLNSIEMEDIYYLIATGEREFAFGIDPDPVRPGKFGEPFVYTDALYAASKGVPSVDQEPYEDDWGRFYSAFSPVFNSNGKVVAIISADFTAAWYEAQINQTQRTVLLACILFLILSSSITFYVATKYNHRMSRIKEKICDLAEDMDSLTKEFSDSSSVQIPTDMHSDDIDALETHISELQNSLRDYISHTTTLANSMITAMAADYRCVYHVNLDMDDGVCYRNDPTDHEQTPAGIHFHYLERFTWYANNSVTEKYREGFLNFINPDNIRERLTTEPLIAYRYLANRDNREYYEMIRIAGVRRAEDRDDHIVHAIGLGLTVIDEEMRESMAKNEKLAEALALAEEASTAKSAFLSNMSHEIRTPMNAIIGLDTLALHDEALSEQTRDYLEKIGGSAQHLLGLINDILDMSRIESGRVVLRKEEFSFGSMLEQINTW